MTTTTIPPKLFAWLDPVNNLPEDQLNDLASQTQIKQLPPGAVLFDTTKEDNNLYYVLIGEVELTTKDNDKFIVKAKTEQARHPLGSGPPYKMSAKTITPVKYITVNSNLLDTMLVWAQFADQEPEVVMTEDGIFTVDKAGWLKKMIKSPTFSNLPSANIEQLLDLLEPIKVPAGEIIIRQGDLGDYFYMIEQGCALVTRQTAEEEEEESIELAELSEGTSFGEAALISDKPRNATVSMMSDGILLRLSKSNFITLLTEPNVRWITYERATEKQNNNCVWLDVRLPSEFNKEHITDAINIPVQQLHRRAKDLDKRKSYICYCDNGKRSSAASFILKQHSIEVYVLKEGIDHLSPSLLVAE
ncbi:hypothetical protein MNBD_GAMMA16-1236 [hydrothermal vent metagenome]|uniref:cAMP-binding proteins - catabolite gene activator and regulatory subunit of cAMP-dependent protein kinases n=1 Tax=hydrothermal vent metagenome TaxID=652676 RepID=A0A3B0Z6J1_9ZZZZ